jgi:hypothetical protein
MCIALAVVASDDGESAVVVAGNEITDDLGNAITDDLGNPITDA